MGTRKVVSSVITTWLKSEEHLLLTHFCKVEFILIELLENFINPKFCWPFLEVTPLIQLCYKTIRSRNDLCFARGNIIPKKPLSQPIFPLPYQQIVQIGDLGRFPITRSINLLGALLSLSTIECVERQLGN